MNNTMIIAIITTIVASITRRRLIKQSLQFYYLRQSTIWVLIWLSIIGVASIISFPYLYQQFYHAAWNQPLTSMSSSLYLIYALIVGGIMSIIVFYRAGRQIYLHQLSLIIIISIMTVIIPWLGWYSLYYFLLAASVEEYVKYYLSLWTFTLYGITSSDIILFGMLSGLGFACVENIVYLSNMIGSADLITINLTRWLIGPIVHMFYSGGIAYWYWYLHRRGWWVWWVLCSACIMILLHTSYNAMVAQLWWGFVLMIIVIGYVAISWMIYQCDRLYFEAKNNLKTTS